MKQIIHMGRVLALIIDNSPEDNGYKFYTNDDNILQFGRMCHEAGQLIAPHVHTPYKRETLGTNEVIYIEQGRLKVNFYADDRSFLQTEIVDSGTWLVLIGGGHGFEVLEKTVIFEVKNGPYAADKDKTRF